MSDLNERITILSPRGRALLQQVLEAQSAPGGKDSIARRHDVGQPIPLSFSQESLWIADQLARGTSAYNEPLVLRLSGPLEVAALSQSVQALIARHEALRTTIQAHEGDPMQIIAPALTIPVPIVDLQHLPERECERGAMERVAAEAALPFDLTQGPLLRVILLRLAVEQHLLILVLHHIVTDGWSVEILLRELPALYSAFSTGNPSPLPDLPIHFADYALWQREYLQGEKLERLLAYWKGQLAEAPAVLELPADHPRQREQRFQGGQLWFQLSPRRTERLRALCQQEQTTLFITGLAAFVGLLSRYTESSDIVVGSPIANRDRPETAGIIGYLANMLVLRTSTSGAPSFRELVRRVRQVALAAYAHQALPFERVVEAMQPERSAGYNPLFQVSFALEQAASTTLQTGGLIWQRQELAETSAKFDLQLTLYEGGEEGISGRFVYDRSLFEPTTIARLNGNWLTLLEAMLQHPDQPIATLPLLTQAEYRQVLESWNATEFPYPKKLCVSQLVQAQADRTPDAVAVAEEGYQLSYQELNRRANKLAHHLQALGVGANVPVAVNLPRSLELVVSLLAILKAGGAYVPLDPTYPAERLSFIVRDAQAAVCITSQPGSSAYSPEDIPTVYLRTNAGLLACYPYTNLSTTSSGDDLAYIIYTSGSTGQPKGVQITHDGLLNLIYWHQRAFAVTAADRATQVASPAFDATGWELWPYLTAGASIYLPDEEARVTPIALRDWLLAHDITLSFLPTPLAEEIIRLEWPTRASLRYLLTGGDTLHHYPPASLPFALVNNYGPTESTVVATSGQVLPTERTERPPSIGRPIANTQIYILDAHMQPVPVGVPGELYIGGVGLARGYLNRPKLDSERFIQSPFSAEVGARLYKTGDLARWRTDGTVEFLGRLDHQVKLRGLRIELGEIESLLIQHPAVQEAVVLAREDTPGEKRLVAYVVPKPGMSPEKYELRGFLQRLLPAYMVPAFFILLSALPLTTNGKVDRQALPAPELRAVDLNESSTNAARTPLEQRLAAIWSKVLEIPHVGREDDFFALGGYSLLAVRILAEVNTTFQVRLSLADFFEHPSIAALGGEIERWLLQRIETMSEADAALLLRLELKPTVQ